ncbi:MAG: flavin reductase family protein [Lachnospiraceae bacterium]
MGRVSFKPGNMLYPLPAVMVSCMRENEKPNIITVAWTGTVCSDPAMVSISVRKERFSHGIIRESGEFVVNLTTEKLARATDYCGVRSGREVDKFKETGLTPIPSAVVKAPSIAESPVSIECRVTEIQELGSHDLFLAKVVHVSVDDTLLDEKNTFHLNRANLLAYSHGRYYGLGKEVGSFGFSVRKKGKRKRTRH